MDLKAIQKHAEQFEKEGLVLIRAMPVFYKEIVVPFLNRRHRLSKYFKNTQILEESVRQKVFGFIDCLTNENADELGDYLASLLQPKREVIHKGVKFIYDNLTIPTTDRGVAALARNFNLTVYDAVQVRTKLGKILKAYKETVIEPMCRNHLYLVPHRISKIFATTVEYDDLVGYGNEGLVRAVNKFDFTRGLQFSTFAVQWIDEAIKAGIANQTYFIHVSTSKKEEIIRQYNHQDEIDPELQGIFDSAVRVRRFSEVIADGITVEDMIGSNAVFDYDFEHLESVDAWLRIKKLIRMVLTDDEYEMLCCRFGLFGRNACTLKELGDKFGISDEWARNKVRKILSKIRKVPEVMEVLTCVAQDGVCELAA